MQLKQISQSEAKVLELPFYESEIHAALMEMNGDKALGSNGFTVAFWQSCWEFVKEEVLDMFKEFYEQNSFIKSLNNTFLVLLPKKGGAEDLVLVNSVPASFFSSSKGQHQGDPLSPYLFVMGIKVLSVLITRAAEGGFISECSIWRAASRLKINLDKSEVIPAGEVEEVNEMAAEIGCKVGQLPAVYLGLSLGAPNKATSVWDGVEEKVRRRLAL
ncbi:hypothetical protein CK203_028355 [Vitis vinifera]|uniref:Reverse transcriptase domain-containing protein n=1 Tax=Vitis vinifera TaxID=29760 RepID=A0A438J083_VITVI|nr:hypothetical protein CK203_028355 [Vitis vinifera]